MRRTVTACASLAILFLAASVAEAQQKKRPFGKQRRSADRVKAGDMAPDFTLKTVDGKKTVKLSSFRGKKPVALIFGSYT